MPRWAAPLTGRRLFSSPDSSPALPVALANLAVGDLPWLASGGKRERRKKLVPLATLGDRASHAVRKAAETTGRRLVLPLFSPLLPRVLRKGRPPIEKENYPWLIFFSRWGVGICAASAHVEVTVSFFSFARVWVKPIYFYRVTRLQTMADMSGSFFLSVLPLMHVCVLRRCVCHFVFSFFF